MPSPIPYDIVVIYHANCRDGISAAYAAWKKFGDRAAYLPQKTQEQPPEGLVGKELYILDYSYPKDVLEKLAADNTSVVVIDHHQSAREAVEAFPQNIFDLAHSGATLAWAYFHPEVPAPRIFAYIEEHDLWKDTLPESGAVAAAIGQYDFTSFASWEQLVADTESEEGFAKLVAEGKVLRAYIDKHVEELAGFAEEVEFDGHRVLAVNCARPYRSAVCNLLAERQPPFAIVWYRYDGAFHISLRSTGTFDVAEIAERYGGGGHRNASSIRCSTLADLPFHFLTT